MPLNIEKQCDRLGLDAQWKRTIERYIRQFDSFFDGPVNTGEHDSDLPEKGADGTSSLIHTRWFR